MKYRLICDPDPEYFEDMINEYISKGWKLCGGTNVLMDGGLQILTQAMIIGEPND